MKTTRKTSGAKRAKKTPVISTPARPSVVAAAKKPLRVVGLGCSAGGLEACEQFLTHLPADSGMAFVLVCHLDPDHKGIMPELLQRRTAMKVCEAEDGMAVRPNRLYVIPANKDLSLLHGRLQLLEPSAPRGLRLPIDFFFKHLAQDQGERSVGIILSGMGTDGSLGLKAIKESFGITMAQELSSAKYDGMPRSAAATGAVDIVAPAEALPARLLSQIDHAVTLPDAPAPDDEPPSSALQKIFVLLRARTGHDFSGYKRNTIHRRLERRLGVHQFKHLAHYVRYLQENPQEIDLLFRELLIGVTSFFRDPAAFTVLQEKAIPPMLARKTPGTPIRVWVPGCSTGEEAYSLAMVLRESLDTLKRTDDFTIQIFATDLGKAAIEQARQGSFPANIAADVPADRLKRFFLRSDHGYTIKKEIRELVVFAPQNILLDPPFTKLDLLSCRNVLIYLNAEWQKKVLALFHYALNPGGILFLGPAETTGGLADLFAATDSRWKIFTRSDSPGPVRPFSTLPAVFVEPPPAVPVLRKKPRAAADIGELAQRALVDSYVPPAVVITAEGDIVYIVGHVGKYLEPTSGKANLNLFAMAREGLRIELGAAVHDAVRRQASVSIANVRVKTGGDHQIIKLTVKPFDKVSSARDLLMVIFEEATSDTGGTPNRGKSTRQPGPRVPARALEKELHRTRERLGTTIEEAEAAHEELKAANEELQSNNEELQSTNEELTTSKEELQSLNEEMTTVNSELQTKMEDLSKANDDMTNLLNSSEIATIFTDNHLRLKRFTPQASRIINFIPADVGRPISDLATHLKYDHLVPDARHVLTSLIYKQSEVQTNDDRWHLMRILPYRTADNVIDGVVITFTEITPLKQLEASLRASQSALQEARVLAESVIATMREPLLVLDGELQIVSANRAFYRTFKMSPGQVERHSLFEIGGRPWQHAELRRLLLEILPHQTELQDFRIEGEFPVIGKRVMLLNARRIERPEGRPILILLAMEDITEDPPAVISPAPAL